MSETSHSQPVHTLVRDPQASTEQLAGALRRHCHDLEIARSVARHPNCSERDWRLLCHFLPMECSENPTHGQRAAVEEVVRGKTPVAKETRWYANTGFEALSIETKYPSAFKLNYYLTQGTTADKRHVLSLKSLGVEWLLPFVEHKDSTLRRVVAAHGSLPIDALKTLARDSAKSVREAVAANKASPPELLAQLAADENPSVVAAAIANPSCPSNAMHAANLRAAAQSTLADKPATELSAQDIQQILSDPATSAPRLEEIARSSDPVVRAACALHPNASAALLAQLARDSVAWVRESAACNPAADQQTLESLHATGDPAIWLALAMNPTMPSPIQLDLARNGSDAVRRELADTTETLEVWQALVDSRRAESKKDAGKAAWETFLAIAINPKSTASNLNGLQMREHSRSVFACKLTARHTKCPDKLKPLFAHYLFDSLALNPLVAMQLLENPGAIKPLQHKEWKLSQWMASGVAPGHVVDFYLRSNDPAKQRGAAGCAAAPLRLLQPLTLGADTNVKKKLLERPLCTRFMFEWLARDTKDTVREAVAKHPECPTELLLMLAQDRVSGVRAAAEQHKNFRRTAAAVAERKQERIANDTRTYRNQGQKSQRVRMAKESQSQPMLRDLALDRAWEVRKAVAENGQSPDEVVAQLVTDEHAEVRTAVAMSRREALKPLEAQLAADASAAVQKAILWRSQLSAAALEHLLASADEYVRQRALQIALKGAKGEAAESLLMRFADDLSWRVRAVVASATTNAELQLRYAADPVFEVARDLGDATDTLCLEAARVLAKHPDSRIRYRLASRTRYQEIYLKLLEDKDMQVRNAARQRLG